MIRRCVVRTSYRGMQGQWRHLRSHYAPSVERGVEILGSIVLGHGWRAVLVDLATGETLGRVQP